MIINSELEQLTAYGQTMLGILIVILLGILFYYISRRGLTKIHKQGYISKALQDMMQVTLRWIIIGLVVLISLQQIGVQLTSVWAAISALLVFVGVGLVAVWSVLSNALCSLLLLVFRPFSIGDKIEIIEATGGAGLQGKVVNINLLYTFIIEENQEESQNGSGKDVIVQVPNNTFFQKTIRCWPGIETRHLEEWIFKNDAQSIKQNAAL